MKPLTLRAHEVRHLAAHGDVLVVREVKPRPVQDRYFPGDKLEWNPGKAHYTECNANWNPLANAFADYVSNGHAPVGPPGTRHWVREAFFFHRQQDKEIHIYYQSDRSHRPAESFLPSWGTKTFPAICMRQHWSRFTVETVEVQCKRVQEVTDGEAKACGFDGDCPVGYIPSWQKSPCVYHMSQHITDWSANPFCWFARVKKVEPKEISS